jgi:hypothetical protein
LRQVGSCQRIGDLGRSEDAALALLRIPIHFSHHRSLAAASLFSAASELEKAGQRSSAIPLYQELLADYGGSSLLGEAERRLNELLKNEVGR